MREPDNELALFNNLAALAGVRSTRAVAVWNTETKHHCPDPGCDQVHSGLVTICALSNGALLFSAMDDSGAPAMYLSPEDLERVVSDLQDARNFAGQKAEKKGKRR